MNSSALIVTYTLLMVPSIPDKTKTKPISPQPLGPESRNAPRPQRRGALRDSSTSGCEGDCERTQLIISFNYQFSYREQTNFLMKIVNSQHVRCILSQIITKTRYHKKFSKAVKCYISVEPLAMFTNKTG